MADVVLFHHAHGLTDGVQAVAEALREAGHVVHTPDLFGGSRFATVDEGVAYAEELGFVTIIQAGASAVAELPERLVYIGFSLGVLPAQMLAQTRPGAAGAQLVHACAPPSEFSAAWPTGVPVQIHAMRDDPFFTGDGDLEAAQALVEAADHAELFLYDGDQHLFSDPSLASYDAAAAGLLQERVVDFLDRC